MIESYDRGMEQLSDEEAKVALNVGKDGRKSNGGGMKLTKEVLERVYLFMPAYKEAKESGNRVFVEKVKNEMTMGNTIFNANSLDAYFPAYKALTEGKRLTATHKGNQIVAFFLEKIKMDYSEEIYRKGVVHFHEYLTNGENKNKPLYEYRSLGQKCALELGLELDFSFQGESRRKQRSKKMPVLGVGCETRVEFDEFVDKDIEFLCPIDKLTIPNVTHRPPNTKGNVIEKNKYSIKNSLSEEQVALKEKNRKKKGNRGEEIAIRIERERLRKLGYEELIPCIKHVAKSKDGHGYDIESVTVDDTGRISPIFIEVKATMYSKDTPFYLSRRELEVAREKGEQYFIYRIYNMRETTNEFEYYVIQGDVSQYYRMDEVSYIVHTR